MKNLRIACIHPPSDSTTRKEEIVVTLHEDVGFKHAEFILSMEQWLNTHSRARFHITVE